MPISFSVPLPGPFRYSRPIRRGVDRGPGVIALMVTGLIQSMLWILKITWWLTFGTVWVVGVACVLGYRAVVYGWRAWHAEPEPDPPTAPIPGLRANPAAWSNRR